MKNQEKNMQNIISHLKNSGFVFQGSEIYGGLANTWDYGPLGVLLKENIINIWKTLFIKQETNNYLIDSKILMNPQVWVTSGHVINFNDPLIENKINKKRYRADKLIQEIDPEIIPEKFSFTQMQEYLNQNLREYENSKAEWSEVRKFNLMFETHQGVIEGEKNLIYLRPETTQGIIVNFKNVQRSMRAKIPFGIAQIGKSFRNEVTPGNFIFRTREFEQMELEYFTHPTASEKAYEYYTKVCQKFTKLLGLKENNLRLRNHDAKELAHYSSATRDIEFLFPFGWGELLGIANRTDYDLKSHMQATKENFVISDPNNNEKFIPYVIEPSMGLDRLMLAVLCDAYDEEKLDNNSRVVLRFAKEIAPYQVAILPLSKQLNVKAKLIFDKLIKHNINCTLDDSSASIGKKYRRQDAIGTYYCITYDFDSLEDKSVTIRNRDTMEQIRIKISDLLKYLK